MGEVPGRLRAQKWLLIIHAISHHGKSQSQLGVFLREVDLRPIEVTVPVTLVRVAPRRTRVLCIPKFVTPHPSPGQQLQHCNACHAFPSQKSPSAPAHPNSSNPNIFPAAIKVCCDASRHPWVRRGSIPFILRSHSHRELCCGGVWGGGELMPRLQPRLSSMNLPVPGDGLEKSHR